MTELQILRNALFDEIVRIKRGTAHIDDTKTIIASANTIVQTYNTELKAVDLIIKAKEAGADLSQTSIANIYEDDKTKNIIDYKAKDDI